MGIPVGWVNPEAELMNCDCLEMELCHNRQKKHSEP